MADLSLPPIFDDIDTLGGVVTVVGYVVWYGWKAARYIVESVKKNPRYLIYT